MAPFLVSIVGFTLATVMLNRILSDVADNPEGKVAAEIQKQQFRALQATQEPFYDAAHEAEIAPRYQIPQRELAVEASITRQGLNAISIAGPESRELLDRVAARVGMSPQAFRNKINPMRAGDMSSLSQVAFGRNPARANISG